MKRIFTAALAVTIVAFLCGTVFAQGAFERKPHEWTNKNSFQSDVELNRGVDLGTNANITSSGGRYLMPQNYIRNSLLGVWSTGASVYNTGTTLNNVPDGWVNPATNLGNVGVSKIPVTDVAFGSGGTVYNGFPYSMQIDARNKHNTGAGVTGYFAYPGDSGASTSPIWYRKFAGKRVAFGAWVWRDLGQYTASGVSTNFIRPYIKTSSSGGFVDTNCTFGDYQTTNGWQLLSAVTTVPTKATAMEVGFALNPTILSPKTGDSAFICAPFLLIDPVNIDYVPTPRETVYFVNQVAFDLNSNTDATAAAGTSSFDVQWQTSGRVPQDAEAYYVTLQFAYTGTEIVLAMRSKTGAINAGSGTGATYYPISYSGGGTTRFTVHEWVRTDYNGDFDLWHSGGALTGISFFITGAQYRN